MKSLLLAAVTFFCVYMTLVLAAYFFKVDFRFFTLSIKTIDPLRLSMLLRYAPFFAVFYVINSLTLNASVAVSGKKEWVNTLLCALENVGGLCNPHRGLRRNVYQWHKTAQWLFLHGREFGAGRHPAVGSAACAPARRDHCQTAP